MNEPTLNPKSGFFRLKIEISYDGTNYAGWAKQPDQRTIQGEIEAALSKVINAPIETMPAGRTDAGVHALSQIIHTDLPESFNDIENLAFKLNRILDADIRVLNCVRAEEGFHARFSPTSRVYEYKIADGLAVIPPLKRLDTAPWYRHIDENLMNEACKELLGKHDFKAFCKQRDDQNTIRTLMDFSWSRRDGILVARVEANAFCYSMVRNLVGAAVCVGEGRYPKEWILKVLNEQERVSDSYVFPANGLTLVEIKY